MAAKRQTRINPNAAFEAIVGITPVAEAPAAPPPKAEPPRGEHTQKAKSAPKNTSAEPQDGKKLVQKGYYLTEEQVRRLGITAVVKGVDRSSIVRDALEAYFAKEGTPV